MVETGHKFYRPCGKVCGLESNVDLLQYPNPSHNKCSLIVRERELLMKYKHDQIVKIHLWLEQVAHFIHQGKKFAVQCLMQNYCNTLILRITNAPLLFEIENCLFGQSKYIYVWGRAQAFYPPGEKVRGLVCMYVYKLIWVTLRQQRF